jgi:hypothetical protein
MMDLMIPGSIELEAALSARLAPAVRGRLSNRLREVLWEHCGRLGSLDDLPEFRAIIRPRGRGMVCEVEFNINGRRVRGIGCGGSPEDAVQDALRKDFRPVPRGFVPREDSKKGQAKGVACCDR